MCFRKTREWILSHNDLWPDSGKQSRNSSETSTRLFLDRMSNRRQWNLYVYSLDTASGAAYNRPLTETDRQTPRLDRTGAGKRKLSQEDKVFLTFYFFVWRRWWHNLSCYQMVEFAMWEIFTLCNPWSTGALDKEVDTIGWRETENRPSLRQEFPHGAPKPAEMALQLTARPPIKSHSESSSKRIRSSIYTLTAGSFSERAAKQIKDKRYGGHRSR